MSLAMVSTSSNLGNKDLQKFVDHTVELLKLGVVQAVNAQVNPRVYRFKPGNVSVGGRETRSYPTVESIVSARFKELEPQVQKIIASDLGRDQTITASIRRNAFDIRSDRGVLQQVDLKQRFSFVNETSFGEDRLRSMAIEAAMIGEREDALPVSEAISGDLGRLESRYGAFWPAGLTTSLMSIAAAPSSIVVNRGIKFRVHEVKCIDETNPEFWGHDEIAWGGATVDDRDVTTKIPEYFVGGGFDDGDRKTYAPPKIVRNFGFGDRTYPKTFLVTMALAEKDGSGMSKFIDDLWKAIKAHVQVILTALGAAAGAGIGTAVGGSIGTAVAGPLGAIIGVVAGAILGALIGWLIGALKDDIFPPEASSITLNSPTDTFAGGSLVSRRLYFNYRAHGGHYRVAYDWEIVR